MSESKTAIIAPKRKPGRKPAKATKTAAPPRTRTIELKSEGQRLLASRPEGSAELSRLVGVTPQRIDEWQTGRGRPSGPNARKIEAALGIPVAAWARQLGAPESAESPSPIQDTTRPIRDRLEDLNAGRGIPEHLRGMERTRWIRDQRDGLKLLAAIDRQDALQTDAVIRASPHWRWLRANLCNALRPFPEALAAVVSVLERFDAGASSE